MGAIICVEFKSNGKCANVNGWSGDSIFPGMGHVRIECFIFKHFTQMGEDWEGKREATAHVRKQEFFRGGVTK